MSKTRNPPLILGGGRRRKLRVRDEFCTNDTSVARVKNFDFDNDTSENFHTLVLSTWQMNDYRDRNNFTLKYQNAFDTCTTNFVMDKAISKSYTLASSYKCLCTYPHSYALLLQRQSSFRKKATLCKTKNILFRKTIENKAKWIVDFERTFKMKVRSRWEHFSKFRLH